MLQIPSNSFDRRYLCFIIFHFIGRIYGFPEYIPDDYEKMILINNAFTKLELKPIYTRIYLFLFLFYLVSTWINFLITFSKELHTSNENTLKCNSMVRDSDKIPFGQPLAFTWPENRRFQNNIMDIVSTYFRRAPPGRLGSTFIRLPAISLLFKALSAASEALTS